MSKKKGIEYGELICPNCQWQGMNKYKFWSSRKINEYTKQWLFYNKDEKRREWKCWSILSLCKKEIKNWYDPGGCCRDPCSGGICDGIFNILYLYFLFGFIYIGYIFFFLWFDIFYFLCYKETFYVILMADGEEKKNPN